VQLGRAEDQCSDRYGGCEISTMENMEPSPVQELISVNNCVR
jgi:hypothetical protein